MELYLSLLMFVVSTSVTPGPNNIMAMTSGLNFGIKKSLPLLLGICSGFAAMTIVVGLGFSVLFERWPIIHEIIKVMSVLYLLYLAWMIAASAPSALEGRNSKPLNFIQGALFQWVNPKAWVVATGAISAFTSLSSDPYIQVFIISLAFLLFGLPCVGVWLVGGVGLKRYLQQAHYQRLFNGAMAILLVTSIVPVIRELLTQYFG